MLVKPHTVGFRPIPPQLQKAAQLGWDKGCYGVSSCTWALSSHWHVAGS